jgi:hypothetical protein
MTYSSALSMSRGHYAGRNQNVVSFGTRERTLGPVSNTIILIVLTSLVGLLYLTQVTKINANGYLINGLQEKQSQLQAEHDNLVLASAQLQSLDRVQTSGVAGSMVPVAPTATVQN